MAVFGRSMLSYSFKGFIFAQQTLGVTSWRKKKKKRGRPLRTVFAQRISINGSHEKVFKAEVAPTKTHTPSSLRNTPAQTRTHTLLRPWRQTVQRRRRLLPAGSRVWLRTHGGSAVAAPRAPRGPPWLPDTGTAWCLRRKTGGSP